MYNPSNAYDLMFHSMLGYLTQFSWLILRALLKKNNNFQIQSIRVEWMGYYFFFQFYSWNENFIHALCALTSLNFIL